MKTGRASPVHVEFQVVPDMQHPGRFEPHQGTGVPEDPRIRFADTELVRGSQVRISVGQGGVGGEQ